MKRRRKVRGLQRDMRWEEGGEEGGFDQGSLTQRHAIYHVALSLSPKAKRDFGKEGYFEFTSLSSSLASWHEREGIHEGSGGFHAFPSHFLHV